MKIFKFFGIYFLLFNCVFANVSLKVPNSFISGENLVFSIEFDGSDLQEMPDLSVIDGFPTQQIKNYSYLRNNNGKISKKNELVYSLLPNKDVSFPSLKFKIDSVDYVLKAKKIIQKQAQKTKSEFFDLEIIPSKDEVFVGEKFVLKVKFKYKNDSQLVDLDFSGPKLKDFWYTQLNDTKKYREDAYTVLELKFLVSALKEGEQVINPFFMDAKIIDLNARDTFFSNGTKNLKIYSNSLKINVKALPQDINLIGKFDIFSSIDKTEVKKTEAISYKLKIEGEGNFDDIEDIKLDLPNVTIYENKPKIETRYENEQLKGVYTKVFSIIANESFTIPKIEFKYFDKDKNKIVSKFTQEYHIKVQNTENKESVKLEKSTEEKNEIKKEVVLKSSLQDKIIYFVLGITLTLIIIFILNFLKSSRKQNELNSDEIIKKIKKTKNKEELLKKIVPYTKKDENLDKLIFSLENSTDFEKIKKEILKIMKKIRKDEL